jgi:uncharacterized phage protein (TIGR02218 family)
MSSEKLKAHLKAGLTTLCRCWSITRRDGVRQGFTDHDLPVEFDGLAYAADAALTAAALQQTTGLSVDNSEAVGALSDSGIREADIHAGRYDGAEVLIWLVNWAEPEERMLQFRGALGELTQIDGAFRAELRGLTEALNAPQGRVFQGSCSAVLGDAVCRADLDRVDRQVRLEIDSHEDGRVFRFPELPLFEPAWFERGRLVVESGEAAGLMAVIKNDRVLSGVREIEVWDGLRAPVATGDMVLLEAGCDKRAETCKGKFQNFLNFQGFPHIPGDDWLISYPKRGGQNDGGSLVG